MADAAQLEILKKSVYTWNLWKLENLNIKVDLRGANLFGADLVGVDLSDSYLSKVNLNGADLSGANFSNADLSDTELIGADLLGVIFKNTKYNEATRWPKGFNPKKMEGLVLPNLSDPPFSGSSFFKLAEIMTGKEQLDILKQGVYTWNLWRLENLNKKIDLNNAILFGSNLSDANLSGANLSDANLLGADLVSVDLSGAYLSSTNLNGADLSGANLTNADLSNAKLIGADLQHTIFKGTKYNKFTKWPAGFNPTKIKRLILLE